MNADILSLVRHPEEDGTTETLADERSDGCTRNAQFEVKNEQRSENQIQQYARHDAFHRVHRVALKTHHVVESERSSHERST